MLVVNKWNERFSLANQWSTSACSTTHAHAQGQNGIVSRRISTDCKQGHIKIAAPSLSLPAGMSRVRPEGAEQLLHLRRAQVEAEAARAAWFESAFVVDDALEAALGQRREPAELGLGLGLGTGLGLR